MVPVRVRPRPGYPPRVQRWRFADPPIQRGWFWAAVVAGPVGALALVATFAAMIALDARDSPGIIDDSEVMPVVTEECELMTSTVEGLPLQGTPEERAQRLRDQNTAVEQMVAAIRELDDDVLESDLPLLAWLDDWDDLVDVREAYAEAVASGRQVRLDLPTDDTGEEIVERMNGAGLLTCEVPDALVEPVFADSRSI